MTPANLLLGTYTWRPDATEPACLETLPKDLLHEELLPMVAANGDLLSLSQTSSDFRLNALTFSQHTINRLHMASIQAVNRRRRGQTDRPPSASEFRQLAACNKLLSSTLNVEPELTREELYRWEVDESQGIRELLSGMRDTSSELLYAAEQRASKIDLSESNCWGVPKGIGKLKHVTEVDLSGNEHRLGVLGYVSAMTQLTHLYIQNNDFRELDGVEKLRNLTVLDASSNPLDSIEPLRGHPALRVLNLARTTVEDLTPLVDVATLRQLTVPNSVLIPDGLRRPDVLIALSDE